MIDKILAGISAFVLLIVIGTIGYNELAQTEINVIVNLKQDEDPFTAIRQITPVDSRITHVKELDRSQNTYVLTVKTKRGQANLLEWLMRSSKVENAEIENAEE